MEPAKAAFLGAAEQARMLAAGMATSPELLEIYLERIGRLDPELNAYRIVRADKARREADDAQHRIDSGERLPLLGVAVAIKDDIDVAGELTAWGTAAHGPSKERDAGGGAPIAGGRSDRHRQDECSRDDDLAVH